MPNWEKMNEEIAVRVWWSSLLWKTIVTCKLDHWSWCWVDKLISKEEKRSYEAVRSPTQKSCHLVLSGIRLGQNGWLCLQLPLQFPGSSLPMTLLLALPVSTTSRWRPSSRSRWKNTSRVSGSGRGMPATRSTSTWSTEGSTIRLDGNRVQEQSRWVVLVAEGFKMEAFAHLLYWTNKLRVRQSVTSAS